VAFDAAWAAGLELEPEDALERALAVLRELESAGNQVDRPPV